MACLITTFVSAGWNSPVCRSAGVHASTHLAATTPDLHHLPTSTVPEVRHNLRHDVPPMHAWEPATCSAWPCTIAGLQIPRKVAITCSARSVHFRDDLRSDDVCLHIVHAPA